MKLLTFCAICSFLATRSYVVAHTLAEKNNRDSSDESSDYSDLFSDAVKGVQTLLRNAVDDDSDSVSDSDSDSNSGILQQDLNSGKDNDEDDDVEEIEVIFNSGESMFDKTLQKLKRIGKGVIDEFSQGLRDLAEVFVGNEKLEETTELTTEIQQTNSQDTEESSNSDEQDTNGSNVAATEETDMQQSTSQNVERVEENFDGDERKKSKKTKKNKNKNNIRIKVPETEKTNHSKTDEKPNNEDGNSTTERQ